MTDNLKVRTIDLMEEQILAESSIQREFNEKLAHNVGKTKRKSAQNII